MSTGIYSKLTGYHNRRTIRLPSYDYSQPGFYFVTICIHDRKRNLFGEILNDPVLVGAGSKPAPLLKSKPAHHCLFKPNQYGEIVWKTWHDLPMHVPNIELDEFVVMPNHLHGILRIVDRDLNRAGLHDGRAGLEPAPTVGLPEIVRQLKTFSARRINTERNTLGHPVWQRNYYDHIIRDGAALFFIRNYIRENPFNWTNDSENHLDREIVEFHITDACNGNGRLRNLY